MASLTFTESLSREAVRDTLPTIPEKSSGFVPGRGFTLILTAGLIIALGTVV
jgi:hypothetical protein